jgi:hypothetical protein
VFLRLRKAFQCVNHAPSLIVVEVSIAVTGSVQRLNEIMSYRAGTAKSLQRWAIR